jgi:hypothetical protein
MRKFAFVAILALVAGVFVAPAVAADDDGEKKFSFSGEVRTRFEMQDNYDLLDIDGVPQTDDSFNFWPYRVRLGFHGAFTKNVHGYVEIQNNGVFGGDYVGAYPGPNDPLAQFTRTGLVASETQLYQGFIKIKEIGGRSGFLKIGRQEHVVGTELVLGDNDFYNGTFHDGFRAGWDAENWMVDLFYYTHNEGSASIPALVEEGPGGFPSDHGDFYITGATAEFGGFLEKAKITPYIIYARNNLGFPAPPYLALTSFNFDVWTFGLNFGRPAPTGDDEALIDYNFEIAGQTGTWDTPGTETDISTYISEGWVGFNFEHGENSRSRIWAGYYLGSGTAEDDTDYGTWIPLFQDVHAYNRLGDLDLFNPFATNPLGLLTRIYGVTDFNIGYKGQFGRNSAMLAVHLLQTSEDVQVGPNRFENQIGTEIDLRYGFDYSQHLTFLGGFATLMAGNLADEFAPANDSENPMRFYVQARLRF